MAVTAAKHYRPKLATLMSISETNYSLLMRIFAHCETVGAVREFAVSENTLCHLSVVEVTKYTSLIDVSLHPTSKQTSAYDSMIYPSMRVRLYHDARTTDVLSSQGLTRVKPRYDYPNPAMHHPDEKQQIVQFLKDWLQLCLKLGYNTESIAF